MGLPVIWSRSRPEMRPCVVCPERVATHAVSTRVTGIRNLIVKVVLCKDYHAKISMRKRWKRYAICALIAVLSAAAARLLSETRFFRLLNLKALDLQFILRGRQPVSQIVLIVADDKSLGL